MVKVPKNLINSRDYSGFGYNRFQAPDFSQSEIYFESVFGLIKKFNLIYFILFYFINTCTTSF